MRSYTLALCIMLFILPKEGTATTHKHEKQHKMKTHSISRIINASPEKVFYAVTDYDNYKNWNTVVVDAKGRLEIGSKLDLTLKTNGKTRPFRPKVVESDSNKSFLLSKAFISKGVGELTHKFEFVPTEDGKTKLVQTWTGNGFLVKMMWSKIEEGFSDFEIFNDDLEKYLNQ